QAGCLGLVCVPARRVGGSLQVPRGHQVCEDVVVGDRGVLVGTGDTVDPKPAVAVVMAEASPQPSGLYQQAQTGGAVEILVAGRVDVADHCIGDVRVDVEGSGARRPVGGALLAADGAPRKC